MKKELSILFALLICFLFSAKAQDYKWVKGGGTGYTFSITADNERSKYISTDPNGNVYSLNKVSNSAIYADTFYRSSAYGDPDAYLLTSYNCSGQMRWAKLIASTNGIYPLGLTTDSLGHVYLVGTFYNNGGSFHIGYDTTMSTGYICAATIQFDTNGHFNWIRFVGQNTFAAASASVVGYGTVVIDKYQNLHYIKLFKSGVQLTSAITSVYGTYDLTYTPTGNLTNVKRLPLDSTLTVYGAAIDTSTNRLFVQGRYNGLISSATSRAFIAEYDTARNLIWSDTMYNSYGGGAFAGIATDNIGHLYIAGSAYGVTAFRGDTVTSASSSFVIKTDTSGTPQWMTRYLGNTNCAMLGFTSMPGNKMAFIGNIAGQIVSGADTITSYSGEANNIFFSVLDTGGCVHTLEQLHGNAFYDFAGSIAADRIGNLYLGGAVGDSVWGGSVGYRSHGGNTDFFVTKYGVDCSCTSMPVANYTVTRSGLGGSTVVFNYTGTSSGLDSMRWDFADGSTSTTTSPTHTYTAPGTYHATVHIYSSCGGDMHCMDIFVPCVIAPTAAFTFSGTTATRSFNYTGTTVAVDSIAWDFGDGGHATGTTTSHSYTTIGTFTACATVYTPCGSSSVCHTVTVPCVGLPAPSFSTSGITASRSFTYTGSTTALDSTVWHFGDGSRSMGSTVAHTYSSVGSYTVCVLAYTPCGVDSSCSTVTITCVTHPTAAFTNTGITTINFSYTGTSTGLDSVVWHYGDGGRGTGATSSHTYATVGAYTVCVLAYNHCGVDSTCHTVTIACVAPPTASFTNTPITTGSYTDTFAYTGTTTGLDSVAWYFGDGGHGTGLTAYHTYALPDTYTVCVYSYNPCGWDSACYTVIVPCDTPVASFTYSGTIPVNFTYTGTTNHVDSVVWVFSSAGGHAVGMTAAYSYPTTGTYLPCVIAYGLCANDTFCLPVTATGMSVSSISLHSIVVYPNPTADELFITEVLEQMCFRLLNVAGMTLQQGILEHGSNALSLKNYASGIYVLEVTGTDGQRNMVKVVKE